MKAISSIILVFILTLIAIAGFSQGKLDQSKEEINKGRKTQNSQRSPSPAPTTSPKCNEEKSIGELFMEGVGKAMLYITYYSTVGNYKAEEHLHSKVTTYPYYNNRSGNYESSDSNVQSKNHFRFDLDYQFIYSNKNLAGNHFKINIRPFQYFFLQAQYHQLSEYNPNNTRSSLSLFNFNICYDRLRFEKFNLGWKLGMCYISNNVNKGGFSFGLDGEAFLIKPFSLYISKQWGSINNVAVNEFETGLKFHRNRYTIQLGYEHLKIGSPRYDYIALGAGIRL